MTDITDEERRQFQGILNRRNAKRQQFQPYKRGDNGSE